MIPGLHVTVYSREYISTTVYSFIIIAFILEQLHQKPYCAATAWMWISFSGLPCNAWCRHWVENCNCTPGEGMLHTLSFEVHISSIQMKGTEVPNPWHSSASDCTCVLTGINHSPVTLSCLPCTFCFVPTYAKFAHEFPTLTTLVQLIFSFLSWFHTVWYISYCFLSQITLCFSFGSKDMITAFTCLHLTGHTFVGSILTANGQ